MIFKVKKIEKLRGMGDVIATVAEPIKEGIMQVAPERLKEWVRNCNCNKRREWLNTNFPIN